MIYRIALICLVLATAAVGQVFIAVSDTEDPDGTPPPNTVNIDATWLANNAPSPYSLSAIDTQYVLQTDVTTDGAAFTINNRGIWLNLNGYTITYDDLDAGATNSGFETNLGGDDTVPASWDMTSAAGATRTTTSANPLIGEWYVDIVDNGSTDQTIISDWFDLPASTKCQASFVHDNKSWEDRCLYRMDVEHSVDGIVSSYQSYSDQTRWLTTTPATVGDYRVRFTYVHEDRDEWQASTEYEIGDTIVSAAGDEFFLKSIDGVTTGTSGVNEPTWGTTVGGLTVDNEIRWMCSFFNETSTSQPPLWAASTAYGVDTYKRRPTIPNGYIYTPVRIIKAGYQSGESPPTWRTVTNNDTIDDDYIWVYRTGANAKIDAIDVRPYSSRCIDFTYWAANPNGTVIKGGTITQGDAEGFEAHGIYCEPPDNITVRDMAITTSGLESAAVYTNGCDNVTIVDVAATGNGIHKFNRHQLAGVIHVVNSDGVSITGCMVSNQSMGGIYTNSQCTNGEIVNNDVFTYTTETNLYGIIAYGDGMTVDDNTIVCDPGLGLRLHGDGITADGNTITINSAGPNWTSETAELDGIRVNSYFSYECANITVSNNTITVNGDSDDFYSVGNHEVVGITCNTSGAGIIFEDNIITSNYVDANVTCYGIEPGSQDENVIWRRNTITSDDYCIRVGDYSKKCNNVTFDNNTLIKGANATVDYQVMFGNYEVDGTEFIDTTITGGGDLTEFNDSLDYVGTVDYDVISTLSVTVEDGVGSPINGATVVIEDTDSTEVYNGTTGADGTIPDQELLQYTVTTGGSPEAFIQTYKAPYTVTASYGGNDDVDVLQSTEGPQTLTSVVTP